MKALTETMAAEHDIPSENRQSRILIIDDEVHNVHLLERVLRRNGYAHLMSTGDPRGILELMDDFNPDIVLLDLHMPHKDGFEVMFEIQAVTPVSTFLPIIILTADVDPAVRKKALSSGAHDFLLKPFDATEVILRVKNLLRTRYLNMNLELKVNQRSRALEETQIEVLQRLAQAAEFRDDDTGQHTQRVGKLAAALSLAVGWANEKATLLRQAAPLHDVGKIGISDLILLKPGRLTSEEFEVMKQHTVIGANILSEGRSELMNLAERIALTHHERWDGNGYPNGIAGEGIPPEGRMLAIVDVFDALTHERPYKAAWTVDDALEEITRQSGTQFDPEMVAAFQTLPHQQMV